MTPLWEKKLHCKFHGGHGFGEEVTDNSSQASPEKSGEDISQSTKSASSPQQNGDAGDNVPDESPISKQDEDPPRVAHNDEDDVPKAVDPSFEF